MLWGEVMAGSWGRTGWGEVGLGDVGGGEGDRVLARSLDEVSIARELR